MSPSEEWRDVVGLEGWYEVSNLGRVRSLPRAQRSYGGRAWVTPGRLLKNTVIKGKGYHVVSVCADGFKRRFYVHTLVLEAFVGPRPSLGHQACHNDGDPSNNSVTNLRWDTAKANTADKTRHGTQLIGSKHHKALRTEEEISKAKSMLATMTVKDVSVATGISQNTLNQIKHGRQWRHL